MYLKELMSFEVHFLTTIELKGEITEIPGEL